MFLAAGVLLTAADHAGAAQLVRVGAAHFPPYVVRPEKSDQQGLLPQLLASLNRSQSTYNFVMVPTSVTRRFRDFAQGRVDLAIFENPQWGWRDIAHTAVDLGLEDEEVFVARQVPGRGQDYFNELSGKHLALFNGYHYAFAQFNASPDYLTAHFKVTLTYSHESNLLMLNRGRVDIAPMTRSFLRDAALRGVVNADELLISERVDQVYRHYALIQPGSPISGAELTRLLRLLHDSGQMKQIFSPYDIRQVSAARSKAPVGLSANAAAHLQ
ncbi:transporter substrate-binding domain-containing protein [Pseudomonas sp. LJDD11]|uniref:transporter substrate-binding domain-containing protein n=2 Tax=Pseudomonadota TaxID=1224 RepID=UPI00211C3D68|nr:transporter substrate-binding domain-containing protein [Pseudomonas sp. LJDD11]MCQ9426310.1 transporter substrate-binding domain-containing protein [Pseudomonas sp. LJDD11]